MTGSVRKAQELIAELGSCFPLQWRFFSSVALQQQPVACLEVPAQKSRRAVPAAFALPLQQGRAREGAQGRRRRAAGAGRCPPTPLPRFLLGSSCGPELEERQGRAVRQMGTAPPPPSRGGCRWRSWCCLAAGGRGGAGGSQGSSGAVGRAAAVPREKVTGGRAMDRRVPEKAPRRAVVPGRGPAGSASEARGGGVGGPRRVGTGGGGCLGPEQPGGGSAGQLPALRGRSCLGVAACRAAVSPVPPPCFQPGRKLEMAEIRFLLRLGAERDSPPGIPISWFQRSRQERTRRPLASPPPGGVGRRNEKKKLVGREEDGGGRSPVMVAGKNETERGHPPPPKSI